MATTQLWEERYTIVQTAGAGGAAVMDALSSPDILLFGPFSFDRRSRRLSGRAEDGSDQPVSVGSRALTVLAALTERPGDLVTKNEIMCAVWPGTVVEESNSQCRSLRFVGSSMPGREGKAAS